ncbi:MAG TPA: hypothetical protein VFQ88_14155 [Nevskiaceae bacterium]|nr:hypothetical protein [Nevskiaceae bacterium]
MLGKFLGRGGTLSLDDVGRVLNALDKRVVPLTARCVDAERLRAMTSLFVATVRDEQSFERLVWDEDQ